MGLDDLLQASPVKWPDDRMRAIWAAATTFMYRPIEIEPVLLSAGISPGDVPTGSTARMIWYEAFTVAANQLQLAELIAAIAARCPAFAARLAELESAHPPLPRAVTDSPSAGDFTGFSADASRERQIVNNSPTLLDIRFLAIGVERARAACRIEARFVHDVSLGTGFRVGKRAIITNHHVVFDQESGDRPASSVQVQFGKELDLEGRPLIPQIVSASASIPLVGERADDWAIITLDADPPADAPVLSLAGPSTPVAVDDRVAIIQHPNGLDKKIGLAHNLVRYIDENVVQYWTDTEEGSSGAPVFNEKWEVIALHHAAVAVGQIDEYGYRNQGRSIGRVAARIVERTGQTVS